jgi:hypothetical protein
MKKILSLLLLLIFVHLYAQFDVKITSITIDKNYVTTPTQFTLPNSNNNYFVNVNYTVNLTDKKNGYAIHGLNFKVNGQVYSVMNTGLTTSSNYPYSGTAQYSLNIGSPSTLDFMIELPYHKQVFPVEGTVYSKSNVWKLNLFKPISNNTISTPVTNFNYNNSLIGVNFIGNTPTGGNGSFTYKWYSKKWNEELFSEIPNSNSKNINYQIKESTKFMRRAYSNNAFTESNIIDIKVVYNSKLSRRNYIKSSPLNPMDDYCFEIQYLTSCPNIKENSSENIQKGNSVSFYGSDIQIEAISTQNQELLWSFQWQIDNYDGNGWKNIINAINKDYTSDIINTKVAYRRLAFSEHYGINPLISDNVITINPVDFDPYGNPNNIYVVESDSYEFNRVVDINGTVPKNSEGHGISNTYKWYADCANGISSEPTKLIHEGDFSHYNLSGKGFLPLGNMYPEINVMNCRNGIDVIREVFYDGKSSRSNTLRIYENYSNIEPKLKMLNDINLIPNQSNVNLFVENASNENLKVMTWDINNPSISNEFNIKADKKQVRLNKIFNKGIYTYKVLDKNNVILKEGKFIIK